MSSPTPRVPIRTLFHLPTVLLYRVASYNNFGSMNEEITWRRLQKSPLLVLFLPSPWSVLPPRRKNISENLQKRSSSTAEEVYPSLASKVETSQSHSKQRHINSLADEIHYKVLYTQNARTCTQSTTYKIPLCSIVRINGTHLSLPSSWRQYIQHNRKTRRTINTRTKQARETLSPRHDKFGNKDGRRPLQTTKNANQISSSEWASGDGEGRLGQRHVTDIHFENCTMYII